MKFQMERFDRFIVNEHDMDYFSNIIQYAGEFKMPKHKMYVLDFQGKQLTIVAEFNGTQGIFTCYNTIHCNKFFGFKFDFTIQSIVEFDVNDNGNQAYLYFRGSVVNSAIKALQIAMGTITLGCDIRGITTQEDSLEVYLNYKKKEEVTRRLYFLDPQPASELSLNAMERKYKKGYFRKLKNGNIKYISSYEKTKEELA